MQTSLRRSSWDHSIDDSRSVLPAADMDRMAADIDGTDGRTDNRPLRKPCIANYAGVQWRQREFKVGGDEPCEPTVRLPD